LLPFEKILVANRGEIAVRIIRACKELEIPCVAIYSEADKYALHVKLADESHYIGPANPIESYLNIDKIIDIALDVGADAIHPGYGFLSENYNFAKACEKNDITFIGPSSDVLKKVKNKLQAKLIMLDAGLPVTPGSKEPVEDIVTAKKIGRSIGYPILLKPSAGGGGIGMKIVKKASELERLFEEAQKQAYNAFGDESIYIEKFIENPHHIEIQIVGDKHGNVVSLGERECSIQRRHQKLIEESPSPSIDEETRQAMSEVAVRGAKAINYDNVGTFEFIYSDGKFYFMEVNARIQVEHGITEMRTGIDLVKEQIRIAAGEPISFTQEEIHPRGYAIECRINVEDPYNNFLPTPGKIEWYREPGGFGVRVDSGVTDGSIVPPEYDSLISKVMAWGRTRDEAINRLRRALEEFVVIGVKTTIPLHKIILIEKHFVEGKYDTGYINKYLEGLLRSIEEQELKRVAAISSVLEAILGAQITKLREKEIHKPISNVKPVFVDTTYQMYHMLRWSRKKKPTQFILSKRT